MSQLKTEPTAKLTMILYLFVCSGYRYFGMFPGQQQAGSPGAGHLPVQMFQSLLCGIATILCLHSGP